VEHVRRADLRQADVPLDAVEQRRLRQIGGADVRRGVAGLAAEEPSLGVQARGLRVVAHLDLSAELHEPVERLALGGPGVHRGDHAQRLASAAVRGQRAFENTQTVPAHEGAEQVDAVGRRDLVGERVRKGRLAAGIHQEVGRRERHVGP